MKFCLFLFLNEYISSMKQSKQKFRKKTASDLKFNKKVTRPELTNY